MRRPRPAVLEKPGEVMSLPGLGGAAHNGGISSPSISTATGMQRRQQESRFLEAETDPPRRNRSKAASYIWVGVAIATMGCMGIWGQSGYSEQVTSPTEERSPPAPTPPAAVASEPEDVDTRHLRLELSSDTGLRAKEAGLSDEEIELARRAAIKTVGQALLKPGGIPPSSSPKFPGACNVLVEGFPFVGSKHQRCCKVDTTNPLYIRSKMVEAEAARIGDGELFAEEEDEEGKEDMSAEMDTQSAVRGESGARRGRRLEEEEEEPGMGGVELPGVLRTERRVDDDGKEVVCFPSFIIAGTQKSGTTALTGILEQHPQVRMSTRKEIHYFDGLSRSAPTKGAENYVYHFDRFNASLAMQHRAPFIVGEATPFYLASRTACAAMRKQLPDVRLLVLVREPVKRAYSEYQMKVRRVEEQEEMFKMLARDANKVYDCLNEAFPSVGDGFTPSEGELLVNPLKLGNVVGRCAGEVGAHGKWMDVVLAFVKRIRMRINGSTEKDVLAGRGPARLALKGLRDDVNRCFPLKKLAAAAELRYPGGTWRAQWNKMGQTTTPSLPPGHFRAGGAGGGRRLDSKEDMDSQLFEDGDEAESNPCSLHRRWNETIAAAAASKTQQQLRLFQDDGEALEGQGQLFEPYDEDGVAAPFIEHFGEQYGAHYLDYEGCEDAPGLATLNVESSDWSVADDPGTGYRYHQRRGRSVAGKGDFPIRFGEQVQKHASDSGSLGDDGTLSPHLRTYWDKMGELHSDFTRSGRKLGGGMPIPGMAGGMMPRAAAGEWRGLDWGEWGQKGEREYDETCYVKMEKSPQADTVMRQEIKQLTTCFDKALAPHGGLAAMEEVEARVAAKALDERIDKCMKVTPGISNQYLYRSLYSVQTFHCLRHFPRDQVMFIESDDLRANPRKVLTEVHKFIGVPDYSYHALEQESIMQELNNKYPDFQKRTGWRLDSKYEEMPQELARDVRAFLKPHMGVFARLVGQSFGDWAVDTADGQEAMLGTDTAADALLASEFQKEVEKLVAAKINGELLVPIADNAVDNRPN